MSWEDYIIQNTDSTIDKVKEIIETEGLETKVRIHSFAHKRYYIMNFLRRNTSLTYTEIGKMLGGRHHATIIHGINAHDNFIKWKDKPYLRDIEKIRNYLENPHKKIDSTLEQDVLAADSLIELHQIQEKIRLKKYVPDSIK